MRAHLRGCYLDRDHKGPCLAPLRGLARCCDNGFFGEDHDCQKQPGPEPIGDKYRDAIMTSTAPMECGRNRERALKSGWHVLLAGVAVVEWRTARTEVRKHMLMACVGWHVSCAILDWLDTGE